MIAQMYKCTSPHRSDHAVELTESEFEACKGLCQDQQCKAWYGDSAKLVPIEGTAREIPNDKPEIGQIWRHHENPDSMYLIINAVSRDLSSVFVIGSNDYYTPTGIISICNLHRTYILDPEW